MWTEFNKEFESVSPATNDEASRKEMFVESLTYIIMNNKFVNRTFTKGINQFTDLSDQEFLDYFMIPRNGWGDQQCSATHQRMSVNKPKLNEPASWDWRDHSGVSPVKTQGSCGSCWTFSTVGALEAHSMIKYGGKFTPLSEQQLVDCAGAYDNHGCKGGLPSHAFEYIKDAGGISTEAAYPYFATDNNCTVDPKTFDLRVWGGSVNITEGDEVELKQAVFQHGPVSIAFQVVDGFRDYKDGIYTSQTCLNSTMDINHAVLAVGFGTCPVTGMDYWIVKNSWGSDWGDKGFFKI